MFARWLLLLAIATPTVAGSTLPADAGRLYLSAPSFEYYCRGNAAQCCNSTAAPLPSPVGGMGGVVLMGGGTDVAEAFEWMGKRSNGGGLLVLRTDPSGDDAYDPFILGLGAVSSAATLILKDRSASSDPFVLRKIGEAASIFFAGGDQSKYWRYWQGTPLQARVQSRVDAGCPVGGTSAGEAILSSFVDSALTGSVTGSEALADPYDSRISISSPAFLTLPHLAPIVADMHFVVRDRLGRLLAFLARLQQDGRAPAVTQMQLIHSLDFFTTSGTTDLDQRGTCAKMEKIRCVGAGGWRTAAGVDGCRGWNRRTFSGNIYAFCPLALLLTSYRPE